MAQMKLPAGDVGNKPLIVPALMLLLMLVFCGYMAVVSLTNQEGETNNASLNKFVGKTFKSADHKQTISFTSNSKGELSTHLGGVKADQYNVKFRSYSENLMDDFRVIVGGYGNNAVWLTEHPLGFKTGGGGILYASDSKVGQVIDEMWQVADAADIYYKKYGHYPHDSINDPDELKRLLPSLNYASPFSQAPAVPEINSMGVPDGFVPSDVRAASPMELKWRQGQPISNSADMQGGIRCMQVGFPQAPPLADYKHRSLQVDNFFIEAYDDYSQLIHGADNEIFVIALKKGTDCTPLSAPRMVPENFNGPVTIVVTPGEKPVVSALIFKYSLWLMLFIAIGVVWSRWPSIEDWSRAKRESTSSITGGAMPPQD